MLPETVWTGDVGIYEDFVGGTLSDALRFTNANGDHGLTPDGDRMIFYSDNDSDPADGPGALADTGIPPLVSSPAWDVVEIPNEGLNSFTYVAGTPFAANVYFAFSDGVGIFDIPNIPPDDLTSPGAPSPVPEPSTISFATIGMLLLLARLRFRPTRGAHPTSPGTP
jgi:hypothetical protein